MTSPTPFEEQQSDINPHRDADRERASEVAYSQLRQRGVEVDGSEASDALADLLSAVERFETTVSLLGGDRMVNAPDSDDPEDEDFVLPQRRGDEPLQGYTRRILDAADELASRAT